MLNIHNMTFALAGRSLFEDVSLQVPKGAKVGFVGRNGVGKSTLFRLIMEEFSPDQGKIELLPNTRIGFVAQEAPATSQTLTEFVLEADLERTQLLYRAETETDPLEIAAAHARLADIDAYSAPARAATILSGLGFDEDAQKRTCQEFSGGWRMRISLAATLFTEPDLLLLDEPTNYLDLEGTLWLEQYVHRYKHTIIMISHDRDLLNKSVKTIAHLSNKKIKTYTGTYDQFEAVRLLQQQLDSKAKAKQEAQRAHIEKFVDRFRYKATKAKQAQSRLKALAKMEPMAAEMDGSVSGFDFPTPEALSAPPLWHCEHVAAGYRREHMILKSLNLRIDPDDRIALLGANGNGKSTFAKLIMQRMPEVQGKVTTANKLKIAYFAQHQLEDLNPKQTAFQHVAQRLPGEAEAKLRARVARMGLGIEKMDTMAKDLSGGEKARLAMGLATMEGSHLFILDEPTNHLDIDSREALIQGLNAYQGAVLLISHDRHLIEACADQLWLVADQTVQEYDGDLETYRSYILKRTAKGAATKKETATKNIPPRAKSNAATMSNAATIETGQTEQGSKKSRRQDAAELRVATQGIRNEIKKVDKQLQEIANKIAAIDAKLAQGDIFSASPDKAKQLTQTRALLTEQLESAEETWLNLSSELEAKSGE